MSDSTAGGGSRERSARGATLAGLVLTLAGVWLAGTGMAPDLDGPWVRGWKAHNGGRYAHIARNYARWGFAHAGGAPVLDVAPAPGQSPPQDDADVYAHHPPGVMMLTAWVFRVWGVSERAARLLSFAATLTSLLALAALVAGAAGPLAGGAAALLAGALPMTVVFGTHVEVQGPLVLLSGLATLLAYRRWLAGSSPWPWAGCVALASCFDWFGLYYGAGCAVHAALSGRGLRRAAGQAAWVAALFCGWLGWLSSLPGMSWRGVLGAAVVRVDGGVGAADVSLAGTLAAWWREVWALMPLWPVLLLLVVLVAWRVGRSRRGTPGPCPAGLGPRATLWLLLAPPLLHALLFPAGLLLHSYWLFALPLALAAGLAVGLSRLKTSVGLVAVGLAAWGFVGWLPRAREAEDPIPALLGQKLAETTAAGEGVLTNFEVNVLWPEMAPGQYIVTRPEVSYYADRPLRGGVAGRPGPTAVDLPTARRLLPGARWFLLWPDADDVQLPAALEALGGPPPRRLSGEPPVLLYRLPP